MNEKLINLEKKAKIEVEKLRHKNRMEEIKSELDAKLTLQRIRSAEIRKSIDRKQAKDFMESYK